MLDNFVLGFSANLLGAEVLRAQVHLSTVFPGLLFDYVCVGEDDCGFVC